MLRIQTPGQKLRDAAFKGDLSKVIKYVGKQHVKVDRQGVSKETALHRASLGGHVTIVEYLIKQGATVDAPDTNGETPLHCACKKGHVDVVKKLVEKGAKAGMRNKQGQNALDIAETCSPPCFQVLDADSPTETLFILLQVMRAQNVNIALQQIIDLLDKGAQVNKKFGREQDTALQYASLVGRADIVQELIRRGADVNTTDTSCRTPLHSACFKGHREVVAMLCNNGADIHATDIDNRQPIHYSCLCDNSDVVLDLIQRKADIHAVDSQGATTLHLASVGGNLSTVGLLMDRGLTPHVTDNDGWTPLHRAANKGCDNVVQFLLQRGAKVSALAKSNLTPLCVATSAGSAHILIGHGADVDHCSSTKKTALMIVCMKPSSIDVARVLLEKGAKVNALDENSWTPLHFAAHDNDTNLIELLLENGAIIDAVELQANSTPLHQACVKGSVEAAELLLDRGANPNLLCGNDHMTALHLACREGFATLIAPLLTAGVLLTQTDDDGWNALHYAARSSHVQVAAELLEASTALGIEQKSKFINAKGSLGIAPIHLACKINNAAIVRALLEHGASPSIVKADGWTPLHLAAANGYKEIASSLLEYFANTSLKNSDNETPLDVARNAKEDAVVEMLEAHGLSSNNRNKSPFFDSISELSDNADHSYFLTVLDKLPMLIMDVHEMRVFYTIIGSCVRSGLVPERKASQLVTNALDITSRACKSPNAFIVFRNILCKARQDGFASQLQVETYELRALETRHEEAPFTQEIWAAIQKKRMVTGRMKQALDGLQESVHRLQHRVASLHNNVSNTQAYVLYQNRVDAVLSLISAVAEAISSEVEIPEQTAAQKITARIVDFADLTHIEEVLQSIDSSENVSSLKESFALGINVVSNHLCEAELDKVLQKGNILTRVGVVAAIEAGRMQQDVNDNSNQQNRSFNVSSSIPDVVDTRANERCNADSIDDTQVSTSNSEDTAPMDGIEPKVIFEDAILTIEDELRHPIHAAVKYGYLEDVKKATEENESEINSIDTNGRTALDLAALTGQKDIVAYLKDEKGAEKIKTKRTINSIVKSRAPQKMQHLEAVRLGLARSLASVSPELDDDYDGDDLPLHAAVMGGDIDDVKEALEECGDNLNVVDLKGRSPLDIAALLGIMEVVEMLEERGGVYMLRNKWAMRALARQQRK